MSWETWAIWVLMAADEACTDAIRLERILAHRIFYIVKLVMCRDFWELVVIFMTWKVVEELDR